MARTSAGACVLAHGWKNNTLCEVFILAPTALVDDHEIAGEPASGS